MKPGIVRPVQPLAQIFQLPRLLRMALLCLMLLTHSACSTTKGAGAGSDRPLAISRMELPASLEQHRLSYEREVRTSLQDVEACFQSWGAPVDSAGLINSSIFFESTSAARGHLAEVFEIPVSDTPDTFAGTVVDGRLFVVSRPQYKATWLALYPEWPWSDDAYHQLIVHELAHRAHEVVAIAGTGTADSMGPSWFFEGIAVLCAGQFEGNLPLMDLAEIQAQIGAGRTPVVSYPLYGRLVRSLKAIFGMEVLLKRASEPGFPDNVLEPSPVAGPPAVRAAASKMDHSVLNIDFQAAEAWLSAPAGMRDAVSSRTLGGRVAASALPTFGPIPGYTSVTTEGVSQLLSEMKSWGSSPADLTGLFPNLESAPIRVFVVATGHPNGDAYVRQVNFSPEGPELSEAGEPVVILNANIIAQTYPGKAEDQARDALGVLRHEIFHVLYARYKMTPEGSSRKASLTPEGDLWELVLDEGIGHFLDMGTQFQKEGFPRERAETAVRRLIQAQRLLQDSPNSGMTETLLREANQGKYWDKYGAISGMLFAYVVYQESGMEGLRAAIQEGPHRLMRDYNAIAAASGAWPVLPQDLLP